MFEVLRSQSSCIFSQNVWPILPCFYHLIRTFPIGSQLPYMFLPAVPTHYTSPYKFDYFLPCYDSYNFSFKPIHEVIYCHNKKLFYTWGFQKWSNNIDALFQEQPWANQACLHRRRQGWDIGVHLKIIKLRYEQVFVFRLGLLEKSYSYDLFEKPPSTRHVLHKPLHVFLVSLLHLRHGLSTLSMGLNTLFDTTFLHTWYNLMC